MNKGGGGSEVNWIANILSNDYYTSLNYFSVATLPWGSSRGTFSIRLVAGYAIV